MDSGSSGVAGGGGGGGVLERTGSASELLSGAGGSQETAYVFVRSLGRGAFGEAVLYRKVADNSLVVWKEVSLGSLSDRDRRDSQNEIDILSMLNHTNIVSYYNHFVDEDTLLIEMEYVPCGTLADKIAAQKDAFPEREVLWFFYQLNSAVANLHQHTILHRDIKSLNIFMGRSGLLKLGDFGISRKLASKSCLAQTVVGSPYYMSPELMKGERYSYKSDMWSVGCVLYELLSLSKVFDATNRLQLAYQIVEGKCDDIALAARMSYSQGLYDICTALLDKNPESRPGAEDILHHAIFQDLVTEFGMQVWELNSATRKVKTSLSTLEVHPVVTSQSSEVYQWGGGRVTPQKHELFSRGRSALCVSAGKSHFAVLTVEKKLYTWTNSQGFSSSMLGQLGHGDRAAYKAPQLIQALEEIPIKQVACGEDFTVCVTDEGQVYTFGSDYYGCLGVGGEGEEVLEPVLVPFFQNKPVEQVSCGEAHVVALTRDGEVYTWGCGEFGRLGLGSEDNYDTPQKVAVRGGRQSVRSVHASADGTFLLKSNGRVLACGSNEHNKLGFNSSAKGLRTRKTEISYDIPCKYTFTAVKPLSKYNIVAVSGGTVHTACIDAFGYLITFGSNKYGQLGVGDNRERHGVTVVAGPLAGQRVTRACCGDNFTVIATADNHLYSFGLADNGRLGSAPAEGGGSGAGGGSAGQYAALPRPIFGSLHIVSAISCHSWNTIVIAEKVLSQKTIRSTSTRGSVPFAAQASVDGCRVSPTDSAPGSYDGSLALGTRPLSGRQAGSDSLATPPSEEGSVAPWLQAELADEFIPYPGGSEKTGQSGRDRSLMQSSSVPPWLQQELADAEFIPMTESGENNPTASQALDPLGDQSPQPTYTQNGVASTPDIPGLHEGPHAPEDTPDSASISQAAAPTPQEAGESVELQLARLRARISQLELDETGWRTQNAGLRAQNEQISARVTQLESNNRNLQQFIEQQADTIRTQAQTIARLEDKSWQLQELQGAVWRAIDDWQRDCSLVTRHSSLATDHGSLATGDDSLATRQRSLATDHGSLATGHDSLSTRHSSLATDHGSLAMDHDSFAAHRDSLATHHDSLTIRHGSVTTDRGSLETHHDSLAMGHHSLATINDSLATHRGSIATRSLINLECADIHSDNRQQEYNGETYRHGNARNVTPHASNETGVQTNVAKVSNQTETTVYENIDDEFHSIRVQFNKERHNGFRRNSSNNLLDKSTRSTEQLSSTTAADNNVDGSDKCEDGGESVVSKDSNTPNRDNRSRMTGPVMAAVQFFNSMSQALQKGRFKSGSAKTKAVKEPSQPPPPPKPKPKQSKNSQVENIINNETNEDGNENFTYKRGLAKFVLTGQRKSELQNYILNRKSISNDNSHYNSDSRFNSDFSFNNDSHYNTDSHFDTDSQFNHDSHYTRTSDCNSRTYLHSRSLDEAHLMRTLDENNCDEEQRRRASFGSPKHTPAYIQNHCNNPASSQPSGLHFQPRSSYVNIRPYTHRALLSPGVDYTQNRPIYPTDKRFYHSETYLADIHGFKRARSVPEQMNIDYEIWNPEVYLRGDGAQYHHGVGCHLPSYMRTAGDGSQAVVSPDRGGVSQYSYWQSIDRRARWRGQAQRRKGRVEFDQDIHC